MNNRFIIIMIGCMSLSCVVSMANTNITADVEEYRVVSTNLLHIEKLFMERMQVAEKTVFLSRFCGSQQWVLSYIKSGIADMIPCFVDYGRFSSNTTCWFEIPSGMDTNGHMLYPDSFPMYDVQEVLASVGAPTNYLTYTPWRPLTANAVGYTNAEMQAGTDSTDYGWKHIVPILQRLRYTEKAPDEVTAQTMRIHSYSFLPCVDYYYGYYTCTATPADWDELCDDPPYILPKQGEIAVPIGSELSLEDCYWNEYSVYYIEKPPPDLHTSELITDKTWEFRDVISNLCVVVSNASSVDAVASLYLIGEGYYVGFGCQAYCKALIPDNCYGDGAYGEEWYYDYPTLGDERYFMFSMGTVSANNESTLTVDSIEPPVAEEIPYIELSSMAEEFMTCDVGSRYAREEKSVRARFFSADYTPRVLLDWQFND